MFEMSVARVRTLAWTDYTKNKLIVVKASSKVDEMKKIILSCAVLAFAVAPTFAQEAANEKKEVEALVVKYSQKLTIKKRRLRQR